MNLNPEESRRISRRKRRTSEIRAGISRSTMGREDILGTIAKLFMKKGYHHTSISDIAKHIGLKGGSLYYHIKSKEQALIDIQEGGIGKILAQLEEINNRDLTPRKKLELAIEAHINYVTSRPYESGVFILETRALSRQYQARFVSRRDRYEKIFIKLVEDGMKQGEFKKEDVRLTVFAILGMINWMVIWFNPDNKGWSGNKITRVFSNLIFNGLLSPEEAEKAICPNTHRDR